MAQQPNSGLGRLIFGSLDRT